MTATCTIDQELNLDTTKLKLEDTTTQAERLLRTLQHMRREEELTDVTLEVDGHSFPCHRNVLAANSPYFSAMFAGGLAEARQDRVTISGISHDVMDLILDYFYTGVLEVSEDRVQELCAAACLHQCDEIREKCSEFMKTKVCESNCVAMFAFSDAHSMEDLKCWSEKYVKQYFKNVCGTSEFLQLPLCQLVELLSLDGLYVDEEETVLDTAKNWMKESPERQQFGSEIVKCIRLPYLGEDAVKRVSEFLHVRQEKVELQLKEQMQSKKDTREQSVGEEELVGRTDKVSDQNTSHSKGNRSENQDTAASLGTDEVTGSKIACVPRVGMTFKEMIIFQTKLVDPEDSHGFPAYEPQSGKVYKLLSQKIVSSSDYDQIRIIHSMVSTPTSHLCALSYFEAEDPYRIRYVHCLVHSRHQEQEWRNHGGLHVDQNIDLRYCALEYFNEHVYTMKLGPPANSSETCRWLCRISVEDVIGRELPGVKESWPWLYWDNRVMQVPVQRVGVLAACGDRLYFMGDTVFYSCDPETKTLTTLPPPPEPIKKLDERPVLTAYKGSLYFLKHRTTTDHLPTLQIFDPSEGKWHVGPRLPLPANKVKLLILQLVVYQKQLILVVGSAKGSSEQEVIQLSFFKYSVRCWELSDIEHPPIGKYLARETLPVGVKCVVAKLTPESLDYGDRFLDRFAL